MTPAEAFRLIRQSCLPISFGVGPAIPERPLSAKLSIKDSAPANLTINFGDPRSRPTPAKCLAGHRGAQGWVRMTRLRGRLLHDSFGESVKQSGVAVKMQQEIEQAIDG
ncbi:hypothetical protein [Bradyrhizobium sp. WSM3983]|uniref:hypothetical protein n=1 Tax=Bradyrhizobium sp. WSM3983 TaxID=1038867 RepID=UPI00041C384E|nr:hypothetical protein [Bradyrhizobium sp. WSM3983]